MVDRFLRGENQPQHVEIEHLVKVLGRDVFQRLEIIDAGIVDQHVEPAERLFRFREQAA